MTAAVRIENFLAGVQNFHRAAALSRQSCHAEFEIERLRLAAERTTDSRLNNANACDVDVEHTRKLAMQVMRHLRRRPARQLARGVIQADGAVRLDGRVRRALEEIFTFD